MFRRIFISAAAFILIMAMTSCKKQMEYTITNPAGEGIYQSVSQKKQVIRKYDSYLNDLSTLPVSFTYDGHDYKGFGSKFKEVSRNTTEEAQKVSTNITLQYRKELQVDIQMAFYPDYCAYEWTLYFTNIGTDKSPLLENVKCADIHYTGERPILKGIYGDGGIGESGPYAPYEIDIKTAGKISMTPPTGRATYNYFPYFNLEYGDGGTLIALGWPIMWSAEFQLQDEDVHFEAGQQTFSAYLEPGEKIRTPLAVFLDYSGRDEDRTMNLWRHWFIDCNMRKIKGASFEPNISGGTSWMYAEMANATDKNQMAAIEKYVSNDIPITYWWMDAGWYFRTGNESLSTWLDTGTWMVDTKRFPSKIKAISDYAARNSIKTLLWFEPEVVRLDWKECDETYGIPQKYMLDSNLADFGNDEFVNWAVERVSQILIDGDISLYRQDYGINPAGNFNAQNTDGRMGTAENHYAQGYYKYWDMLIGRFPDMMIDSCAAGGGRNDVESMRKAVPLHKTDHDYSIQDDKQSMHQTLFQWLPYFGACTTGPGTCTKADSYTMRSSYAPWIAMCWNVNSRELDWDTIRSCVQEWQQINPYYYCDYYPLTDWSRGAKEWRGWQFYNPDSAGGFIQIFRPKDAVEDTKQIILKGLNKDKLYHIRNCETGEIYEAGGAVLLSAGLPVTISNAESSVVYLIQQGDDLP